MKKQCNVFSLLLMYHPKLACQKQIFCFSMIVFWLLTPIIMLKFWIFLIPNFNFWGVPSSFQGIVGGVAQLMNFLCQVWIDFSFLRYCVFLHDRELARKTRHNSLVTMILNALCVTILKTKTREKKLINLGKKWINVKQKLPIIIDSQNCIEKCPDLVPLHRYHTHAL